MSYRQQREKEWVLKKGARGQNEKKGHRDELEQVGISQREEELQVTSKEPQRAVSLKHARKVSRKTPSGESRLGWLKDSEREKGP